MANALRRAGPNDPSHRPIQSIGAARRKLNNPPKTLAAVLNQCWALLREGVGDNHSAMHTPVLGSVGEQGCELRTVILRSFDVERRLIAFYTDVRSPKISDIHRHDRVQWVFYHPTARVQLRATGVAHVHTQGTYTDDIWHQQTPRSRRGYLVEERPGMPSDTATSGLPAWAAHQTPDTDNTQSARENFAVVDCTIDALDWLHLGLGHNTRARFAWRGPELEATWCTP